MRVCDTDSDESVQLLLMRVEWMGDRGEEEDELGLWMWNVDEFTTESVTKCGREIRI